MNAANTVTKLRTGYDLNEASAVKQMLKSKTPMLFIHGEDDSFVPYSMLDDVYNAANVDKEKLIIPGAGHGESELWINIWSNVEGKKETADINIDSFFSFSSSLF
ncbi:hypothetical protein SRABI133_03036 [Peribacillus simplex]|uniref:Alpha/beta hydrolase n=1 Tax=Peribacillus simplex TaxID=1478 RepID=A0A9W4PFW6_9BACI|nr:hypothetical protein SRABI133_03036 [Peribacillus simplex]